MKQISYCVFLTLLGSACEPAAYAAHVEGFGQISTNHPDPDLVSIDAEYEAPVFMRVQKTVHLISGQLNGAGSKTMGYFGEAQIGRVGVHTSVAGNHSQMPDLDAGADLVLGFQDRITPENLDPLNSNYLRLDVDLSGVMRRGGGGQTSASFVMQMEDLESDNSKNLAFVRFSWTLDDQFYITNESGTGDDSFLLGFVPYPGEEPDFTPHPMGGYSFGARGYVDIPLGEPDFPEWPFEFGAPILLEVSVGSSSSTSTDGDLAISDFGNTALIGNARFVDSVGEPIAGASFTSVSGYDYITPPPPITPGDIDLDGDVDRTDAARFSTYFDRATDSLWVTGDFNGDAATTLADWLLLQSKLDQPAPGPAVPEPSAAWLVIAGAATILWSARRRRRHAR
jgi:hypothetical protein